MRSSDSGMVNLKGWPAAWCGVGCRLCGNMAPAAAGAPSQRGSRPEGQRGGGGGAQCPRRGDIPGVVPLSLRGRARDGRGRSGDGTRRDGAGPDGRAAPLLLVPPGCWGNPGGGERRARDRHRPGGREKVSGEGRAAPGRRRGGRVMGSPRGAEHGRAAGQRGGGGGGRGRGGVARSRPRPEQRRQHMHGAQSREELRRGCPGQKGHKSRPPRRMGKKNNN